MSPVYHGFDRQILAKTEVTEGTAISLAAADYVDTQVDIDLTFEPVTNERDLVRPTHTMVPDLHSSTGLGDGEMVQIRKMLLELVLLQLR